MSNFREIQSSRDRVETIGAAVAPGQHQAHVAAGNDAPVGPQRNAYGGGFTAGYDTLLILKDVLSQLLQELSVSKTLLQTRFFQESSIGIDHKVH